MGIAAKAKIYFRSGDITVSNVAVTTGQNAFAVDEIAGVRTQLACPSWLGPLGVFLQRYLLILTTRGGDEVVALGRRNGYFIWKLTHAIEAAIAEAGGQNLLPAWRWAHRSPKPGRDGQRSPKPGAIVQQLAPEPPNSSA